jgi:hypothetical protein
LYQRVPPQRGLTQVIPGARQTLQKLAELVAAPAR